MTMIRLITCDIDGTLLQNGEIQLRPILFEQIRALKERGILFCPASGRQYASLRWLFEPVADDIGYVCENGAILYRDGKILCARPLPRDWAWQIIRDILNMPKAEVLISGANTSYLIPKAPKMGAHLAEKTHNNLRMIQNETEIQKDILKVSAWYEEGAPIARQALEPLWKDKVKVAISGPTWLDFTLSDKGTGLEDLCRVLNIDPADVLSFGDNYNDIPILSRVGRPYLMRSAVPELRQQFPRQCGRPEEILALLLEKGEEALDAI